MVANFLALWVSQVMFGIAMVGMQGDVNVPDMLTSASYNCQNFIGVKCCTDWGKTSYV